jgi:predicted CopG family antitoxin
MDKMTIKIDADVHKELLKLKVKLGLRTISDVIKWMKERCND